MTAFRILATAFVVTALAATASAIDTKPKPIVNTPCDRHDLGPKFPPIKVPPIARPLPGPVAKPAPHAAPKPVVRPK